jgi:hypothetical protein
MIVTGRPYPDTCAANKQIPPASERKQVVYRLNRKSREEGQGDVMAEAVRVGWMRTALDALVTRVEFGGSSEKEILTHPLGDS